MDNDGDGFVDCQDHDCARNPQVDVCGAVEGRLDLCQDGIDNDDDGFIDCADFDCSLNPAIAVEACGEEGNDAQCTNEADDDGDGFFDCDDFSCCAAAACPRSSSSPLMTTCAPASTSASAQP